MMLHVKINCAESSLPRLIQPNPSLAVLLTIDEYVILQLVGEGLNQNAGYKKHTLFVMLTDEHTILL